MDENTDLGSARSPAAQTVHGAPADEASPAPRKTSWTLASHTTLVFASNLGAVTCQTVYFVLIARALGVSEFGNLAAALAIVSSLGPFSGLGAGFVMVTRVARDTRLHRTSWASALLTLAVSAPIAIGAACGAAALLLPRTSILLVLQLALADLLFLRTVDFAAQAFQAHERLESMAALQLLPQITRLIAAVLFSAAADTTSAKTWSGWYLVSTIAGASVANLVAVRVLGAPTHPSAPNRRDVRDGLGFCVSASAATVYTDIDKTLVARLSTLAAAGSYAAGYRVVAFALLPILSLLSVTYARFVKLGSEGIISTASYARRLLPPALLYSLAAGVVLVLGAPLIPRILGSEYEDSVTAIRWLAITPLLQVLFYFPGDALMGAGYQGRRAVIQLLAAGLNVVLCFLLIPGSPITGAAVATVITYAALACGLWGALFKLRRDVRLGAT